MANENDYIKQLEKAIHDLHGVNAIHVGTECVSETAHGKVVWRGEVEIFTITGHPQARICYAWKYQDVPVEGFAVILGIPPVRTELDAVRAFVARRSKEQEAN